ncbi:MAG: hypothetical protein ABI939_09155 [Anaerolineaceae bacterium]
MATDFSTLQDPQTELPIGGAIFDRNGEQFAVVKEVKGGYFKLDLPMARDFWLSSGYVSETEGNRVSLNISRDEADEHKLGAPGLEQEAATVDLLLDNDAALKQRERMEHELSQQNAQLDREAGLVPGTASQSGVHDQATEDLIEEAGKGRGTVI